MPSNIFTPEELATLAELLHQQRLKRVREPFPFNLLSWAIRAGLSLLERLVAWLVDAVLSKVHRR